MKPPLLFRVLPDRLKQPIACRWYSRLPERYLDQLQSVRLKYANGAVMPHLIDTDVISSRLAMTGFHELKLTRLIQHLARQGGRLVDVGANQGYFSILWLANNPHNTCVSVEASPRILPLLKGNIAANNFENHCQLVEAAAGIEKSRMLFDLGPEEQTGWGGLSIGTAAGLTVEVNVLPLDDIITDDQPIAALKIDVEGADTWVLKGATRLLKRKQISTIFFEQHSYRMNLLGVKKGDALTFLQDFGYRVRLLEGQPQGLAEYIATPQK